MIDQCDVSRALWASTPLAAARSQSKQRADTSLCGLDTFTVELNERVVDSVAPTRAPGTTPTFPPPR